MNKTLALLAAAATLVVANTSLAPQAQAGGGVRLQFGYPLGSFVARPCGSCGSSSSYRGRAHRDYAAERRAAAKAAAVAAARRAAIAEAKAEAKAEALRLARLKKLREAREAKELAKAEIETIAPQAAPLPVRAEIGEADVAIGEPKVVISNTKAEPAKAEEKVAVAPIPAPARPAASLKPVDCKKFVPSAGLTITVPCQ